MTAEKKYLKDYLRERYRNRRLEALTLLGNKCSKCGIDGAKLTGNKALRFIGEAGTIDFVRLCTRAQNQFDQELSKYRLLCNVCQFPIKHGTLTGYRYCKCELCCKAKTENNKLHAPKRVARRQALSQERQIINAAANAAKKVLADALKAEKQRVEEARQSRLVTIQNRLRR